MRIISFDSIPSTQDEAKLFIPQREELVIWTREQTKGRGRLGREWHSPPGGLYFSLLLFPPPEEVFRLHLKLFFAAVKGIEQLTNLVCDFKWPNDIFYQRRKLGGILIEKEGEAIIAGCGLNVNNEIFPESIKEGISLKTILQREVPIERLLKAILVHFENPPPFSSLLIEVRKRNFLRGRYIHLQSLAHRWEGRALDIDERGRLLLQIPAGRVIPINSGDVEKIYDY